MIKKRLKVILISLVLIIVPTVVLAGFWMSEESSATGFYVTNVFSDSASLAVIKNGQTKLPVSTPVVYVNGEKVPDCTKVSGSAVCVSNSENNKYYAYYEIDNLLPDSGYNIGWSDTLKGKIIAEKDVIATVGTDEIDENIPQIERIYGRVVDSSDNGQSNVLVIVENKEDSTQKPLSAVTAENGSYSITYIDDSNDNFLQRFTVFSKNGAVNEYDTASFYNKPVADIVLTDVAQQETGLMSMLAQEAYAANSCIKDTELGGIRAQCNPEVDWTHQLNTATCPRNEHKVKLAVIKHTSTTRFHNPENVTLKLFDVSSNAFVKDPNSGEDLVVKNGAYVNLDVVELEVGNKYQIKAYESGNECLNTTEQDPHIIYNVPGGEDHDSTPDETPDDDSSTHLPAATTNLDLCRKMGENFGIYYEIPVDKMQTAVDLRMRWGEAIIQNLSGVDNYKKSVVDGKNVGMNVILRLCAGKCSINDGTAYGNAIVRVYNELKSSGQLPQNGLFIHVGHNEPNASEYIDPAVEAQFMADALTALDSAGILSRDPNGIGVKAISSALDLFNTGDWQWPGCDEGDDGCWDKDPHPVYKASSYVDKLLQNSAFASKSNKLYAWAVNDYLKDRGDANIIPDVNAFTSYLDGKGQVKTLAITELGRINTSYGWDKLAAQIRGLDDMDNVHIMLLFNSLGANKDKNFEYHKPLWNDHSIIEGLLSSCGSGNFDVPQEGETDVYVDKPAASGTGTSSSVAVTGYSSSPSGDGNPGGFGTSSNGEDQCSGEVCVGKGFLNNTTAVGGLLNGDFEDSFEADGANELHVPKYWHAWYQNGCSGGKCGSYSCSSDASICRRPEYKQSSGFDNRLSPLEQGGSKASSQWFTMFGTMYAGMYQHIYLGEGSATGSSSNSLVFSASGSSWSQDYDKDGHPKETPNTFKGRVGIDPTGGINPNAGSVVWSDWQTLPNVGPGGGSDFSAHSIAVETSSERVTVFIAANNQWPFKNSDTYWDNAILKVNGEIAIGDETASTSDGYGPAAEECDEDSQGGPDGDACWDTGGDYDASILGSGLGGNVMGASTVRLPGRGEYEMSSSVFEFDNNRVMNYSRDPKTIPVFQDKDGDGVHDADEYYVPDLKDLVVTKVGDALEYELKPGIMMISVPFYTDDFNEAVEIVQEIAEQGGVVSSIASYSNAANDTGWKSISKRGAQVYGDDFTLSPGDAMYLVVQRAAKVRLKGQSYSSPVQEYVKKGWNLIAIKGDAAEIRAEDLLSELNELPGVVATKVTMWDPSRGRFVSYVKEDSAVYGENFVINEMMGVFVFVKEGVGYWTPGG